MSFDKNYPNRKDHRKQYVKTDSRSFDHSCRNHGSCPACKRNRTISNIKSEIIAEDEVNTAKDDSE